MRRPKGPPPLPSGQTVADIATRPKAIALDQLNLIAVVEAAGLRHALVRLADGRILRVREGDRLQRCHRGRDRGQHALHAAPPTTRAECWCWGASPLPRLRPSGPTCASPACPSDNRQSSRPGSPHQ